MPNTPITTQPVIGPYNSTPVSALGLNITFTTADVANGNCFAADSEGDILIAWNTDTSSHTLTISSQPDSPFLRTGDVTAYALGAGLIAMWDFSSQSGWVDLFGNINFSASSATVKFAVIQG
jgi:hypothetical protein